MTSVCIELQTGYLLMAVNILFIILFFKVLNSNINIYILGTDTNIFPLNSKKYQYNNKKLMNEDNILCIPN